MNDTATAQEWTCDGSINKVMQGYLLSGFLAVVGLLFIFVLNEDAPDAALIGYIQLGFSVLVAALAYRGRRKSGRILVMNNDGLSYRGWPTGVIPWPQIATVDAGGSRINAFLRVTLSDKGAAQPVLKIPAGDLSVPLEMVIQATERYLPKVQ